MPEMPDNNRIPEDEIDIRSAGRKLLSMLIYPFVLFGKHLLITLAFVLAGILSSVAVKYAYAKTYKSSFIIRPNDRNEKFHLKMIGDIQTLLKQKDYGGVGRELNIDSTVASQIAGLQASNPFVKNRSDSLNYTEVTIETTSPANFLPVQTGILNYLEQNPYFKKIRELQMKQVEITLEQVNKDLVQLDSLKELQLARYSNNISLPEKGTFLLNELINPTATYTVSTERLNRRNALLAQKVFLDNFQLIKSCVLVKHHSWPPRILVTCLYLVPAALLLCFLFLLYKEHRRAM